MKKSIEFFKKFEINAKNVKGGGYYCWNRSGPGEGCVDGNGPVITPSGWSCVYITIACDSFPTVTA